MTENNAVAALFVALGLMFAGAALAPIFEKFSRSGLLVVLGVSVALVLIGAIWPKVLAGWFSDEFVASAGRFATDFRVWFGIFILLWLYFAASAIVASTRLNGLTRVVERQILPFQYALERWVVPRTLTRDQMKAVSEKLATHKRTIVVRIEAEKGDEEAGHFAGDLNRAIRMGGWTNLGVEEVAGLPKGLSSDYQMAPATVNRSNGASDQPRPDEILHRALLTVGIQFEQSGGGGPNRAIAEDTLTIRVGTRRRDPYARPFRMPEDG